MDFSNATLDSFVAEHSGLDIYSPKYDVNGNSKAKRLKTLWRLEPDSHALPLIEAMLDHYSTIIAPKQGWTEERKRWYEAGRKALERLKGDQNEHLEAIVVEDAKGEFDRLGRSIRQLIKENKPEEAMDRLHTYVTVFIRRLCERHGIVIIKEKALHSLFGEYVKMIKEKELIESQMGERILKSSISILESFNEVRNAQSFAHANKLLGYDESLLIFRNISSIIHFINSMEEKVEHRDEKK